MSGPRPAALALMGLLFARTMAWASSGKTHPELVNNLHSEYGSRVNAPSATPRFRRCCSSRRAGVNTAKLRYLSLLNCAIYNWKRDVTPEVAEKTVRGLPAAPLQRHLLTHCTTPFKMLQLA